MEFTGGVSGSGVTNWNTREDDFLRKCVSEGRSASYASARLIDHSRNACIGRASRIGLRFASTTTPKISAATSKRPRKPAAVKKVSQVDTFAQPESATPPTRPDVYASVMMEHFVGRGIPLMEADPRACRFPYDGYSEPRCCGEPVTAGSKPGGSPYCQKHYDVCTPKGRKTENGKVTYGFRCTGCSKEYLDGEGLARHHARSTYCGKGNIQ